MDDLPDRQAVDAVFTTAFRRLVDKYRVVYENRARLTQTVQKRLPDSARWQNIRSIRLRKELITGFDMFLEGVTDLQDEYLPLNPFHINPRPPKETLAAGSDDGSSCAPHESHVSSSQEHAAGEDMRSSRGDLNSSGGTMHSSGGNTLSVEGNVDLSGGNTHSSGGNMHSSGGNISAGGNMHLAGGNMQSGGNTHSSGGNMHPAGGNMHTAGGNMHSSGGSMHPAGGNMHSSGGSMHPAGGNMHSSGGSMHPPGGNMHTSGGNVYSAGGSMFSPGEAWYSSVGVRYASAGNTVVGTGQACSEVGYASGRPPRSTDIWEEQCQQFLERIRPPGGTPAVTARRQQSEQQAPSPAAARGGESPNPVMCPPSFPPSISAIPLPPSSSVSNDSTPKAPAGRCLIPIPSLPTSSKPPGISTPSRRSANLEGSDMSLSDGENQVTGWTPPGGPRQLSATRDDPADESERQRASPRRTLGRASTSPPRSVGSGSRYPSTRSAASVGDRETDPQQTAQKILQEGLDLLDRQPGASVAKRRRRRRRRFASENSATDEGSCETKKSRREPDVASQRNAR